MSFVLFPPATVYSLCLKQICQENDKSPAQSQVHRGFVMLYMTKQTANAQVVVWIEEPLLDFARVTT